MAHQPRVTRRSLRTPVAHTSLTNHTPSRLSSEVVYKDNTPPSVGEITDGTWKEPELPKAQPSFAEYGFKRHRADRLFDNMQPLGELPKPKRHEKAKSTGYDSAAASDTGSTDHTPGLEATPPPPGAKPRTRYFNSVPEDARGDVENGPPTEVREVTMPLSGSNPLVRGPQRAHAEGDIDEYTMITRHPQTKERQKVKLILKFSNLGGGAANTTPPPRTKKKSAPSTPLSQAVLRGLDVTPKHAWNQEHADSLIASLLAMGKAQDPINALVAKSVVTRARTEKVLGDALISSCLDPMNRSATSVVAYAMKKEKKRIRKDKDRLEAERRASGIWPSGGGTAPGTQSSPGPANDTASTPEVIPDDNTPTPSASIATTAVENLKSGTAGPSIRANIDGNNHLTPRNHESAHIVLTEQSVPQPVVTDDSILQPGITAPISRPPSRGVTFDLARKKSSSRPTSSHSDSAPSVGQSPSKRRNFEPAPSDDQPAAKRQKLSMSGTATPILQVDDAAQPVISNSSSAISTPAEPVLAPSLEQAGTVVTPIDLEQALLDLGQPNGTSEAGPVQAILENHDLLVQHDKAQPSRITRSANVKSTNAKHSGRSKVKDVRQGRSKHRSSSKRRSRSSSSTRRAKRTGSAQRRAWVIAKKTWKDPETPYMEGDSSLRSTSHWDDGIPANVTEKKTSAPLTAENIATATNSTPPATNGRTSRKRRASDDASMGSSSLTSLSELSSHAGSPRKKQKLGAAKIKHSPMKRRPEAEAEIRANKHFQDQFAEEGSASVVFTHAQPSPPLTASSQDSDDGHDDACATCGDVGDVLMCDNCPRVYHLYCVVPPVDADELPPVWFCPHCESQRRKRPAHQPQNTIWGNIDSLIEQFAPDNFELPSPIQNYFKGNHVGQAGVYVDGEFVKKPPRGTRSRDDGVIRAEIGLLNETDYNKATRLYDEKGVAILCAFCHESAAPRDHHDTIERRLAKCDALTCGNYWHLDCHDPPLSTMPAKWLFENGAKVHRPWYCPRHFSHDLKYLHNPITDPDVSNHRLRVPRHERYSGYRGSGLLEVINNPDGVSYSRPTEDELNRVTTVEAGTISVVRAPENVIVTRFIEAAKKRRMEEQAAEAAQAALMPPPPPPRPLDERTQLEQDAVKSLLMFKSGSEAVANQQIASHRAEMLSESLDAFAGAALDGADRSKLESLHRQLGELLKSKPAAEPTAEPAVEPAAEPAAEPTAESAAEPATEPAAEPAAEPTVISSDEEDEDEDEDETR